MAVGMSANLALFVSHPFMVLGVVSLTRLGIDPPPRICQLTPTAPR